MKIHRLYTDEKGESHFATEEVEYVEATPSGRLSKRLPATGIIFREAPLTYDLDWHPAPRRQYIINLDNGVQITASDGESRVIGAGEVLLVEDTTGKGHLSKAINERSATASSGPLEVSPTGEGGTERKLWSPPRLSRHVLSTEYASSSWAELIAGPFAGCICLFWR